MDRDPLESLLMPAARAYSGRGKIHDATLAKVDPGIFPMVNLGISDLRSPHALGHL